MAVSKVKKNGAVCIQLQGILATPVTIGANARGAVLNGLQLSSAFSLLQLGYIPTDKELVGVVPIWANGTTEMVFTQGYVDSNGAVTISGWNTATASRQITHIRLLTFWD